MNSRAQIKLFDSNNGTFLDTNNVGWMFRDVANEKYDNIIPVFPTGVMGKRWSDATEKYSPEPIYQGDQIRADKRTDSKQRTIEGVVEWHEDCAMFTVRYKAFNGNDNTIWLNGLDNIEVVGSIYTNDN